MHLHLALVCLQLCTLAYTLECYIAPSSDAASPSPTTFHACYQIVKFLVRHERIDIPIDFSRRQGVGYLVPAQWTAGNCIISIDMLSDDDVETASFSDIAHEAGLVVLGCVVHPPHLGGTQWVGERRVMQVSVFGRPYGLSTSMPSLQFATLSNTSIVTSPKIDTA